MKSFATSLFSRPSLEQHDSNAPVSPISSVESDYIVGPPCSLNGQHHQLDILIPPHQLFSPPTPGIIPYAINSNDWYHKNYYSFDQQRAFSIALKSPDDIWDSVYGTTGVVYGIAKVFIALCRSFRIDLHTPAGNILTCVEKAERELRRGSVVDFVFAIEELYFNLYARLEIEIALLHFCSSFIIDGQKPKRDAIPTSPDPNHVYTILNVCKKTLGEQGVCSAFDDRLVRYYKHSYVEEMTRRYKIEGTLPLDPSGYRAHVNDTIEDTNSFTYRHWCQMYPELEHLSTEILAFLSEKYLPIYPRKVRTQYDYSFKSQQPESGVTRELNMICAHRLCSLARIEGKAVGELRREDESFSVMRYAREQKCICLDICACSGLCTRSGSTLCPCSSRWVRGILAHRHESRYSFRDKCTVMGELTYESLAALKRELSDDLVQRELVGGINIIREEMIKQRTTAQPAGSELDIVVIP